MIDFLIKSTISLSLLLGVYYLFLEREKMHTFNRFYLLFSLLFSFAIPFITIEIAVESITEALILPNPIQTIQAVQTQNGAVPLIEKEEISYIPILLWSLYALITVLLAVRFGKNIGMIVSKVRKNRTVAHANSTLVLTKEKAIPHTFLQYIFINEEDFDNRNIQQELYTHELTHVRQKHSYDILLIEVLKTVFWFNPILLFYKKAIQLNHEFLADEKVVKSYNNVPFYQNLLLEKASWNNNFYLASNLNFLVTKKRLIMMTKTTSTSRALLKKLVVLPVLAGLVFILCLKTATAEAKPEPEVWINGKHVKESEMDKPIAYWKKDQTNEASYFAGVRFIIYKHGVKTSKEWGIKGSDIIFDKVYEELTPEDKHRLQTWLRLVPGGYAKKSPTSKELEDFKNATNYAIWIDGVNVKNSELDKYNPSDIAYFSGSSVFKSARTKKHPQPFQYHFYTHPYFDKNEMGKSPEKYGSDKMEIFENVTEEVRLSAEEALQVMPSKTSNSTYKKTQKTGKSDEVIKVVRYRGN